VSDGITMAFGTQWTCLQFITVHLLLCKCSDTFAIPTLSRKKLGL